MRTEKIPAQKEGEQVDIAEKVKTPGEEEAKQLFREARHRLFNISGWENISKGISASFTLTDQLGEPKQGLPVPGDHFRISIPGPGPAAGQGYDWVKVELVEDTSDAASAAESALIKVRPSPDPFKQEGIAHFLEEEATSSFIVKRKNNTVYAEVHGRNEKPNTGVEKIGDKIRNAVVGAAAVKGVAKLQWVKLVKGLLNKN